MDKLDKSVKDHESYRTAYNNAFEWLKEMRTQTQTYIDSHGKKEEVLKKSEKLSKIRAELPHGLHTFFLCSLEIKTKTS